jgi:hypothetical protein
LSASLSSLEKRIARLEANASRKRDFSIYKDDPAGYARDVLKINPTPRQEEIGRACLEPPYRVLVPSGHEVGKTCWGACLKSWWYDTRNPSVGLSTAPKLDQVRDLLWKEIRAQRNRVGLGGFPGPKSLRLETGPKHFAKGVTASSQAGFQGQHEEAVMILIDEAEGVDKSYFTGAKSMAAGKGHVIVCFYNPYSSASWVAQEEQATDEDGKATWRILPMSSLDHPNIAADLLGKPAPIPQAIRVGKVEQWITDYCRLLGGDDIKPTDFEWPPSKITGKPGKWYRPGPIFEAGMLGRRPTLAVDSVWSAALVQACIERELPLAGPLQLGCDVARFGDDNTCIHVRVGGSSVDHITANGWDTATTASWLKAIANKWRDSLGLPDPRLVPIAVDDCGVGGGVVDILAADRWNVIGVNAAIATPDDDRFPNMRSALWCDLADEAAKGNVSFSRLSREVQQTLRREFPSQQYEVDARGRRVCLPKNLVKSELGASPDNADAVNLAFANVSWIGDMVSGRVAVP